MASEKNGVTENSGKEAAEKFKAEANDFFRQEKYSQAEELYSKAIEADSTNAVYYANRSITHLKQENFGYALSDASKAIELDSSYIKAYYRYYFYVIPFQIPIAIRTIDNFFQVWKLRNFSTVTQILRETNLKNLEALKLPVLPF